MEKVHDIESMTGNDFCINCRDGKRTRKSKTLKCILVVLLIIVIGTAISVIVYSLHDDHRVKRCSGHENDQTDTIMNLRDKVASLERRFRKIRQLINNKSRQVEDDTFVRTMVEYDSNKALSKVLVDDIGTEKERAGLGFATIGNDARIGSGRVRRDATDNKKVKRKGKKVKKVRRPKKKKYKNRLSWVQVTGNALRERRDDKTALAGLWKAMGASNDGGFTVTNVNVDGRIKVTSSGFYLIYAQVAFINVTAKGYNVYHVSKGQLSQIASCFLNTNTCGAVGNKTGINQTCSTMKVYPLLEGDAVYIQEISEINVGYYSSDHSYFGLIKVDDIK